MKNIFKILSLAMMIVVTSSCNEDQFFELDYPIEDPWQTPTDFEKAAIGVYYAMTGNGGNGSLFANRRIPSVAISDEGVYILEAGGDADVQTMYNRVSDTELGLMTNVFNASYFIIGTANAGLELFENTDNPFPNFPAELENVTRIRGELHFGRAFAYWSLAKSYCPPYDPNGANNDQILPKRLRLPSDIKEANNSELFTTEELYSQIVDDLKKAKEYLPLEFVLGVHHPSYQEGRVTRFGAAAMLARVLFQMGRTTEALAELNYVIDENEGKFDLSEQPIEAWNKITTSDRGKETIWFYQLADGDGLTDNGWKDIRRLEFLDFNRRQDDGENSNSSSRTLAVSRSFLEAVGWIDVNGNETQTALNDLRYTQLFRRVPGGTDPRFTDINTGHLDGNGTLVWPDKYYQGANRDQTSLPVLRLPEMYLTRAIIRLNNGDTQGAADDLNSVRSRAWDEVAAGEAYTPVTAAEITAEMIHNERMIEMAFEGDRAHYLQAQKIDIPNGDRGPGTIAWNNPGLWFPIREREQEINNAYR